MSKKKYEHADLRILLSCLTDNSSCVIMASGPEATAGPEDEFES